MHRFLVGVLSLWLALAPARAQFVVLGNQGVVASGTPVPAHIQSAQHSNGATSITTIAVTAGAAVLTGDTVILSFGNTAGAASNPITSVTDDKANTYTLGWFMTGSVTGFNWLCYYATGITNGPTVFTVTYNTAGTFGSIFMDEYSKVLAVSPLDGTPTTAVQTSIAAATAINSGTTTTTANGDLIYSSILNVTGVGTMTAGSGYTQDQAVANLATIQHQVQATAAAIAGTGTHSATDTFMTGVLALKHQ